MGLKPKKLLRKAKAKRKAKRVDIPDMNKFAKELGGLLRLKDLSPTERKAVREVLEEKNRKRMFN